MKKHRGNQEPERTHPPGSEPNSLTDIFSGRQTKAQDEATLGGTRSNKRSSIEKDLEGRQPHPKTGG